MTLHHPVITDEPLWKRAGRDFALGAGQVPYASGTNFFGTTKFTATALGDATVNGVTGFVNSFRLSNDAPGAEFNSSCVFAWSSTANYFNTKDIGISRVSAGLMGIGSGAALSFAGALKLTGITNMGVTTLAAGTTALAPLNFLSGTNLTSPVAGAKEFDGVNFYGTIDTSSGRGQIPVEQRFHLTAAGGTISTIANFFGATSNISLVSGAHYEIEIVCFFLNTTSGTVVWTLTNSAAPTSQNIIYEMSPVTGIVAPPGDAAALNGHIYNDATAAKALTATAALTTAVNHFMRMKIDLINSTGTSLKIQATKSAGTITPGIGSYWRCRRIPTGNVGTFSA